MENDWWSINLRDSNSQGALVRLLKILLIKWTQILLVKAFFSIAGSLSMQTNEIPVIDLAPIRIAFLLSESDRLC